MNETNKNEKRKYYLQLVGEWTASICIETHDLAAAIAEIEEVGADACEMCEVRMWVDNGVEVFKVAEVNGEERDPAFGPLGWTSADIIEAAREQLNITVTREQAIALFKSERLNGMKFVTDIEFGHSLIDEAIRAEFR